jgi:uncharacterized secreted protein with C-terminal beta-propeller domain
MNEQTDKKKTFEDPKVIRCISAQLYVSKNITKNPAKVIRFIRDNSDYFPDPTIKSLVERIIKEKNISEEEIKKCKEIKFADLHFEKKST